MGTAHKNDNFGNFCKQAIKDLKTKGSCNVYHKNQIEYIERAINKPLKVIYNDFYYILSINRKEIENE